MRARDSCLQELVSLAFIDQAPIEYPFVFRSSFLGAEPAEPVIDTLAAAVHLIQTSTFLTDDIFDAAKERNGHPTIYAHAGTNSAIIGAQVLQNIGFSALAKGAGHARLRNAGLAVATLADALTSVYRGQYLDLLYSARPNVSCANYYGVIDLTTASLFAGVARCAALLAGRRASEIRDLASFAHNYGMALQITDDILDLTDDTTGKTFGSDLRCRRMRLPLIKAIHLASVPDRCILRRFLKRTGVNARSVRQMARLIERSGGITAALKVARRYLALSLRSLSPLPPGPARDALRWLPESLLAAQGLD
jgi:geranylgeranyl pyrophosphate synthase